MAAPKVPIMSTAGAVSVRNEKGQITVEKVKVSRYVSGKRPAYAPDYSDDEDEEVIDLNVLNKLRRGEAVSTFAEPTNDFGRDDRRLKRLQERHAEEVDSDEDRDREVRVQRHRQLVGSEGEEEEEEEEGRRSEEDEEVERDQRLTRRPRAADVDSEEHSDSEEEELDDEEIERKRASLRLKAKESRKEEEVLDLEEEKEEGVDELAQGETSSEYEDDSDSEEEDHRPRLKPVFVRKRDRITIQEKESEEKLRSLEVEKKRVASERRATTLKMVEAEVRRDAEQLKQTVVTEDGLNSGEEDEEQAYEAWKVRELKRVKREREEREKMEKEKQEADRLHNMTEEERRLEQKSNPKLVTNKAAKGKYKFLQKYYHRGAFFLNEEDEVLKQDFTAATLEDHFDKTVLPKVMQVKNFGRSGRTKYTHLVDQDTTNYESPWADQGNSLKFHTNRGGGMKQVFERPAVQKRK